MADADTAIFEQLFVEEGAVELRWEQASRCTGCLTEDSKQPEWGCLGCGGTGVNFAPAKLIKGIFRSQERWLTFRLQGELDHGEAQLTTPLSVKPGYLDRRVRDRFLTVSAIGDLPEGRVFYPATQARPFIFNNIQRAWRVALQAAAETDRLQNELAKL